MRAGGSALAEAVRLDLAAILSGASALVGAHPWAFAITVIPYIALGTWWDMQEWTNWQEWLLTSGVFAVFGGVLQYLVLQYALAPAPGHGRRFLVLLVAVTVHLLAWTVGSAASLLLLFPGFYLAGRLSAAPGVAIAEREGVVASLILSWRRTRASWWPLLLVQAILVVPLLAVLGLVFIVIYGEWGMLNTEETALEIALLSNLLFGAVAVATWAVNGAAYRLTAPELHRDEDIFA